MLLKPKEQLYYTMRQQPKDKIGSLGSPTAKGGTVEATLQQKNRGPPANKSQSIIQMTDSYPFGLAKVANGTCLVRLIKHFRPAEYAEIKRSIELISTLKHRNLISTVRVLESKNSGQFEVFLEYVEESLQNALPSLTPQQINQARSDLIDLCRYLIDMGIVPDINAKNLGCDNKALKYYSDAKKLDQKINRKQFTSLKEVQVKSLFNRLTRKLSPNNPTVPRNFNSSRSQEVLTSQPSWTPFVEKTTEEPRNSSLTNFNKKPDSHLIDIGKIKNIDERIKKIQQHISKPPGKNTRPSHLANNGPAGRKDEPEQKVSKALHSYMEAHQYNNIREGRDAPIVYPAIGLALAKYEEEDSFDTYNQELGDDTSIPKITHTEMRQTTTSPPRLLFRDKLSESVGDSRTNILALTAKKEAADKAAEKQLKEKEKEKERQREKERQKEKERERVINVRSTSADKSAALIQSRPFQKLNNSSREFVSPTQTRGQFLRPPPEQKMVKRSTNRISDLSHSDDRALQLIAKEAQKRLQEHLNEIRNVQREISIRKLSLGKNTNDVGKKSQRKFTQPRPKGAEPLQLDGPLKYYNLEGKLVAQFNGLMSDNHTENRASNIFERGSAVDQKNMEINERVKLALKKSEATLISFRNRMAWKSAKPASSGQL